MSKKNDAENKARDSGSRAAFLEAADKCREEASKAFLGLHDEAAFALRDLVRWFLDCASQCESEEDES